MRAAAERRSRGSGSGIPGTYWTPGLGRLRVVAGHRPDADPPQDCQSVRIYASELCPRQDSNLRSRLRRPLLSPLSYGGSGLRKITSPDVLAALPAGDTGPPEHMPSYRQVTTERTSACGLRGGRGQCRGDATLAPGAQGLGRVLVVDDDEVIRQLIAVNLTLEGFDVATAVDG